MTFIVVAAELKGLCYFSWPAVSETSGNWVDTQDIVESVFSQAH